MDIQDIKTGIKLILNEQTLLNIASTNSSRPWLATVFFVSDDDLNLYFMSGRSSIHSTDYKENPVAAITIADPKSYFGKVYGLQAEGTMELCKNITTIIKMGAAYVKKFPQSKEEFINPEAYIQATGAGFYKFIPKRYILRTPEVKERVGSSTIELIV